MPLFMLVLANYSCSQFSCNLNGTLLVNYSIFFISKVWKISFENHHQGWFVYLTNVNLYLLTYQVLFCAERFDILVDFDIC